MNKLLKKIYVSFFFLIFSISTFGQEGLLDKFLSSKPLEGFQEFFSSKLDKCINKNINNILDFKIIIPKELHEIKISISQELLSEIQKVSGETRDLKEVRRYLETNQKTIGMFVDEVGINEEFISMLNAYKDLEEGPPGVDMEEYESLMEGLETFFDVVRYNLKNNPKKLKESAEKICNQQGIY